MKFNQQPKKRRLAKIKKKIRGRKDHPRLCVFRSNKYVYAQIIDDEKSITLVSASEKDLKVNNSSKSKKTKTKKTTKTERAALVGKIIAQKAKKKKITKVSFDRRANKYHGRIKAIAQAARKEGLIF